MDQIRYYEQQNKALIDEIGHTSNNENKNVNRNDNEKKTRKQEKTNE